MNKYDFVIFVILMINLIMSFINLVVVDAVLDDFKRWLKNENDEKSKM